MAWLLDTNILSESKRPSPSDRVMNFMATSAIDQLYVSSVTFAEIRFGIERQPEAIRRVALEQWLASEMRSMFTGRVLAITEDIMFRWRLLVEDGRKSGRTHSQPDLIIAATALEHNLTLVTRNVKDFTGLGVDILNPWDLQP